MYFARFALQIRLKGDIGDDFYERGASLQAINYDVCGEYIKISTQNKINCKCICDKDACLRT